MGRRVSEGGAWRNDGHDVMALPPDGAGEWRRTETAESVAVVSYAYGSTHVRDLCRRGVPLGPVLPWGTARMYAYIAERSSPLLLLDLARGAGARETARAVSALALAAPVVVMGFDDTDVLGAFRAGAYNVLDRRLPPVELAARLRADARRCRCAPAAVPSRLNWATASQRLLFEVMVQVPAPVCCHRLRTLFGSPGRPLTLRALKARVQRLLPAIEGAGMTLVTETRRGRVIRYEVEADAHASGAPGTHLV